ncbi:ferritin-like domain-containing protein [Stakelama tenebrarum]|uniref:Ferritin-like domain-containing protein n=1 Tax=Stakelama tenebrarum TaxID=2711215 RepID=A0A6G6Y4H5_9SPHN|nr:ferritin-like domain-containing protein [Sphingosinithalassobacter tenebrarum]QIG79832.1 ferritin-like domain-containing protein [Sphingosinithalassobacter tenebrarum]
MHSIAEAARAVLETAEPAEKVKTARLAARRWRRGELAHRFDVAMPERPAWPERPELLPPNRMPKRGRAGSPRARVALVHALAHIEFVAIDLAFDMLGRFGGAFPRGFVDDWIAVGADEAMHFALLDRRLRGMGSHYGALPAHAGLWEAAEETAGDVMARLAVVPMVLEARGLDVTPATISRFEAAGDSATARILHRILKDEIRHVGSGTKWFESACARNEIAPQAVWRDLVARHFRGIVKPPFNDSARQAAGLTREYYAALAHDGENFP